MTDVVIGKLLAAGVNTPCLVCKTRTVHHFVFKLDVGQLVFQLRLLAGSELLTTCDAGSRVAFKMRSL